MNRKLIISTVAVVALTSLALAAEHWERVKVESKGGHRYFFKIRNREVHLSHTLSDAPCVLGRTYGTNHDGIWVDRGCRAIFKVLVRDRGRNDGHGDGYGGHGGGHDHD